MLNGVEQTAAWTCKKITAIKALMDRTTHVMRTQLPKIYSHELVQLIFEQPYCRISNLVEIGVLHEVSAGKEKLFVNSELMRLMTQDNSNA